MVDENNAGERFAAGRVFAVLSLIAILATAAALAVLYREMSIRTVIEFGEQSNVTVAVTALNGVLPELEAFLRNGKPDVDAQGVDAVPPGLLRLFRATVRDTPVARIKIYNQNGIVLYSSRENEIGTDDGTNPRFQSSIKGEIRSELRYRDVFDFFSRGDDDNLIETYVPIRQPGKSRPLGVFEVYTDVNPIVRAMTQSELLIFAGIAVIMAILYTALLLVVRRSGKIIARHEHTILERNQTLEVLAASMLASEEGERGRVAWELHEEIAQALSAVKLKVESICRASALAHPPPESDPSNEIVPLVQDAIHNVRALAMDLRPPSLDDFGLVATTRSLCQDAERIRGQPGISLDIAVRDEDVPDLLKTTVFRILQQTLKCLVQTPDIGDIRVALSGETGLMFSMEFGTKNSETGEHTDHSSSPCAQRISEVWQRAVLSGGSFSATKERGDRARYQATWIV